ncbi:hypothetical protein B0H16DRAFT_1477109 [Mycena metata]|uniref:Uncharacterized protein n=1 Tax=Mycena metata TaxID=1033252 RepID=A0AAD7HA86_9AGAR|nr:hypothetical protein B0H16DRAFT_1477109 [Mycena metata]
MSQPVTRLLSTAIKRFGFRVVVAGGGFPSLGGGLPGLDASNFQGLLISAATCENPERFVSALQPKPTRRSPMRMSSQVRNKKKNGQAVATHAPVGGRTPVPPRTIQVSPETDYSGVFRTQTVDLAHSELYWLQVQDLVLVSLEWH